MADVAPAIDINLEGSKDKIAADEGSAVENTEAAEVEKNQGEQVEAEHIEGEEVEGEQVDSEQDVTEQDQGEEIEGEQTEKGDEEKITGEEEVAGEELEGELVEGANATGEGGQKEEETYEEIIEEEEYVEPPPPDPSAPYNFTDSQELLKEPFELRPDQLAEVEQLWEIYQDYTPAYTDLDGFITEKELIYMLKSLILMTYTPEQLQELITYCVRPPHPKGHITFDQFVKMVTIRQRDMNVELELRSSLQVLDPGKTGTVDREYFKDILSKLGHKLAPKLLDIFIKEVDISNDGTIGIEDVVGTMCIDLNKDDIIMLKHAIYGDQVENQNEDDDD